MRCAISQPAFIPWLGWFDIFDQADQMVLLDTVQFEKQSWQQRNRIRTRDGLLTITVPVVGKGRATQKIRDVELANPLFGKKLLRTLHTNYLKAPHFDRAFDELTDLVPRLLKSGKLFDLNEGLISWISTWLNITTDVRRSSDCPVQGKRGEYVARLCEFVGADEYLSTIGAREYLLEDLHHFTDREVSVWVHDYVHPKYQQLHEPFLSHTSALDLIMMYGEESASMFRESRRSWVLLDPSGQRESS